MIGKLLSWLFPSAWSSKVEKCGKCGKVYRRDAAADAYGCNNCPDCGALIACPRCARRHAEKHRRAN